MKKFLLAVFFSSLCIGCEDRIRNADCENERGCETMIVERNFKEINRSENDYFVKIFSSPSWSGNVGGTPHRVAIWITRGSSVKKCDMQILNLKISSAENGIIFYRETAETETVQIKGRGSTEVVRTGLVDLAEVDHKIEFTIHSETCQFDFNFEDVLIYQYSEKKITFWDALLGI